MPQTQEELPSPIQTCDEDLGSGADTVESLNSGPQSIKTESSTKTEASKAEASIKTRPSSAGTSISSGKPSTLASPSASLNEFLLSDSPRPVASCNGSSSDAAGASFGAVPPLSSRRRQQIDDKQDHTEGEADVTSSQAAPADEQGDRENALSSALSARRPGHTSSPGIGVLEEQAADAALPGKSGENITQSSPHDGKEDWGGQSEGMYRKRVSLELKEMLRRNGGVCLMQSIAGTFKRHHGRHLNLQGKKLRTLLTSGRGLYGIGLYGTGQQAEIRLKEKRATKGDGHAVNLDGGDGRPGNHKLTRTFVNPHAVRKVESPPRGRASADQHGSEDRDSLYDRGEYETLNKRVASSPSAISRAMPRSFVFRDAPGYAHPVTEESPRRRSFSPPDGHRRTGSKFGNRDAGDRMMQWGGSSRDGRGRNRSPSRSLGRGLNIRRSRSRGSSGRQMGTSRGPGGSEWGERAGDVVGREALSGAKELGMKHGRHAHRRSRSLSKPKRFSNTSRRESPRRRPSPQRRRGRSPSSRSLQGPNRSSLNRRRSHSWSNGRNGSPPGRYGTQRRRISPPGRSPQLSAERSHARRSRGVNADRLSATREKGTPQTVSRDHGIPSQKVTQRQGAGRTSVKIEEDRHDTARWGMSSRQEAYRDRQEGPERAAPQGMSASSPAPDVKPLGYGTETFYGVSQANMKPSGNVRAPPVGTSKGSRMIDPITPLAQGSASIPPGATVSGNPVFVAGRTGGRGGFPVGNGRPMGNPPARANGLPMGNGPPVVNGPRMDNGSSRGNGSQIGNGPPRERDHASAGDGGGHPSANGETSREEWSRSDVGGIQGGGGGSPRAPHLAPALLPPLSSLRPLPIPNGSAQGARLMIKGTHPAVPERRIHALVCTYGIVGKIEVLEGFVFVHMKSLEEASRAVAGLNGKIIPHVSPQVGGHPAPPPPRLVAAIWREENYLALMSKENMRMYADSMRKASTWYEKQTKSGFVDTHGERMHCRFFALGRGCIFGINCGFSHERPPQRPRGSVNSHGDAGGRGFGPTPPQQSQRPRPHPAIEPGPEARAGVPPFRYRQERAPVLAHQDQSPKPTFIKNEPGDHRGLEPQRGRVPAYNGNAVGVAMPWNPQRETRGGGASAPNPGPPHQGASNGRGADREQLNHSNFSKAVVKSEPQPDIPSHDHATAHLSANEISKRNRPSAYRSSSGSRGGGSDGNSHGRSRKQGMRPGSRGRSPRAMKHEKNRSRERGNNRRSVSLSVSPRRSNPRRGSGGIDKSGRGKVPLRENGRQRERGRSRSSRSKGYRSRSNRSQIDGSADRGSGKRRRDSRGRRSNSHMAEVYRGSRYQRDDRRRSKSRDNSPGVDFRNRRRDYQGRHGESNENAADRSYHRHRRDSSSRQPFRRSRSNGPGRRPRDSSGNRRERSTSRRGRAGRSNRGSFSPSRKERYHESVNGTMSRARRRRSDSADSSSDVRMAKRSRHARGISLERGYDRTRREDTGARGPFLGMGSSSAGRRDDGNVNHGWVSHAQNPSGFSRDVSRQSIDDLPSGGRGEMPHDFGFRGGDSRSQFGSVGLGNEFDDPVALARPVKTQFTVTARLQPPPISSSSAAPSHAATKFSITVPPNLTGALAPTSPSGGARRGGRPARGRGRGGRFGHQRDGAGRRPPRGHQHDGEDNHFE